ncbi:hypothetical protein [Mariniluteicoccus flavus]
MAIFIAALVIIGPSAWLLCLFAAGVALVIVGLRKQRPASRWGLVIAGVVAVAVA